MRLVQACLCARKICKSCFNNSIGPVKLVQACLSVRKDLENSFHHCRGRVMLVPGSKGLKQLYEPPWRSFEARAGMFRCQERSRKSSFHHCAGPVKFVQACLRARKVRESSFHHCSCVARASLFQCGKQTSHKAVLTAEKVL